MEEKVPVKNLERAKTKHSEQETYSHGMESWWVGWVCLIYKVTLEVSWSDLLSLMEARWLKQFLEIAFSRIKMI